MFCYTLFFPRANIIVAFNKKNVVTVALSSQRAIYTSVYKTIEDTVNHHPSGDRLSAHKHATVNQLQKERRKGYTWQTLYRYSDFLFGSLSSKYLPSGCFMQSSMIFLSTPQTFRGFKLICFANSLGL